MGTHFDEFKKRENWVNELKIANAAIRDLLKGIDSLYVEKDTPLVQLFRSDIDKDFKSKGEGSEAKRDGSKEMPAELSSFPDELFFFPMDNTKRPTEGNYVSRKLNEKMVDSLKNLVEEVPIVWIKVYDKLFSQTNTAKYCYFRDICKKAATCGISDIKEVERMVEKFHELGALVYFKNDFKNGSSKSQDSDGADAKAPPGPTQSILDDFVVLNPQWIINQIRKLIFAKSFKKQPTTRQFNQGESAIWDTFIKYGLFNTNLIRLIWTNKELMLSDDGKGRKKVVKFLLDLMERHMLLAPCQVDAKGPVSYIVPSMLRASLDPKIATARASDPYPYRLLLCFHGALPHTFFEQLLGQLLIRFPSGNATDFSRNLSRSRAFLTLPIVSDYVDFEIRGRLPPEAKNQPKEAKSFPDRRIEFRVREGRKCTDILKLVKSLAKWSWPVPVGQYDVWLGATPTCWVKLKSLEKKGARSVPTYSIDADNAVNRHGSVDTNELGHWLGRMPSSSGSDPKSIQQLKDEIEKLKRMLWDLVQGQGNLLKGQQQIQTGQSSIQSDVKSVSDKLNGVFQMIRGHILGDNYADVPRFILILPENVEERKGWWNRMWASVKKNSGWQDHYVLYVCDETPHLLKDGRPSGVMHKPLKFSIAGPTARALLPALKFLNVLFFVAVTGLKIAGTVKSLGLAGPLLSLVPDSLVDYLEPLRQSAEVVKEIHNFLKDIGIDPKSVSTRIKDSTRHQGTTDAVQGDRKQGSKVTQSIREGVLRILDTAKTDEGKSISDLLKEERIVRVTDESKGTFHWVAGPKNDKVDNVEGKLKSLKEKGFAL